ncbi:MAG: diaminopimelate epimerase [Candidatus Oxydemutatoraceae bacterium WSBS_2016_MAG_OTU14]
METFQLKKTTMQHAQMSSLGNQFIVVDQIKQAINIHDLLQQLSMDAHCVFDQLLVIEKSNHADIRMRIFNRDGSEVEQCGNGLRCIAAYAKKHGLVHRDEVLIEVGQCVLKVRLLSKGRVCAEMGLPIFVPEAIPILASTQQEYYAIEGVDLSAFAQALPLQVNAFAKVLQQAGAVSMGNPHLVLNMNSIGNVSAEWIANIGQQMQCLDIFPNGVNVGFMSIKNHRSIGLRVYERGVGETQACGSGACAAVAVGRLWGLLENQVQVHLPGGVLDIRESDQRGLIATGPVTFHSAYSA